MRTWPNRGGLRRPLRGARRERIKTQAANLTVRPTGSDSSQQASSKPGAVQYLALRLAALELQVEQGFTMPLIADDLFINFDDRRTAAGLKVLGDLSRSMQVVFLTHHDHLVPLAKEVLGSDLNVVEL